MATTKEIIISIAYQEKISKEITDNNPSSKEKGNHTCL